VSVIDDRGTEPIVWIVGDDGSLNAFEGETGAYLLGIRGYAAGITDMTNYQAPIIAKGRIFVAGNSRLYAFTTN